MFKTLSPILSIILAVAIFFFFAKPLFSEIGQIQEETSEYREAVEKAEEFNSTLSALIAKRNSFTSLQLERLETFVPDTIDEVRALIDVKALAEQHGLLFGRIEIEESTNEGRGVEEVASPTFSEADLSQLDIGFQLIGTYEQMRSFLLDLERSLLLMEVVGITFTANAEGDLQLYNIAVRLYALDSSSS